MKFWAIRHGETSFNNQKLITGLRNPELTQKGIRQITNLRKTLPEKVDYIFSSKLKRCIQSAELINLEFNVPVILDERLNERSFGSLQGKSWEEIDPSGKIRAKDLNFEFDYHSFGGETHKEVLLRTEFFLADLLLKYKNTQNICVTSSGIIKAIYILTDSRILTSIGNGTIHEFTI